MTRVRGLAYATAVLAIVAVGLTVAASQQSSPARTESRYTTIELDKCQPPAAAAKSSYEASGLSAVDCGGTGTWRIFNVSSDERSWIDVSDDKTIWTTEPLVVYEDPIGNFPNIGASKAEWIMADKDRPMALIFRISALKPDGGPDERVSRLYVVALGHPPRFCGKHATNGQARVAAQNLKGCTEALKPRN